MTKTLKWICTVVLTTAVLLYSWVWLVTKRPTGVNTSPVREIVVSHDYTPIDRIAKQISGTLTLQTESRSKILIFRSPGAEKLDGVYRSINIFQFDSDTDATTEYLDHRRMFTDDLDSWKLHAEGRSENDTYFVSYQLIHLEYYHGFPCGVTTSPEILIAFLKRNLLIVVSYTGYRNYNNYVQAMNEDILYVASLLKECLRDDE